MKAYEVKFTGPAVVDRNFLAKDEKKKGVILPGDLRWNLGNRHTLILKGDLHESAVEFFQKGPHADEFKIKEIDVTDDFFDEDDVAAKPEDLEAARAAQEADEGPETVNAESISTSGNIADTQTNTRAGKARVR